ncbi:MAG: synthase alpha subunit [Candidatus Paceibacter sp.]|jgi:F-type H+-transporting ATPase subunit alpha|nr:synthase alpha subunit [Candidatus Paceibacter sp.]
MSHIIDNLKQELEGAQRSVRAEKIGKVVEVGDGIARISGLAGVALQEMLEFETSNGKVDGVAFNLEQDTVGAIIIGDAGAVKEGDTVKHSGRILSVRVGQELVGRVVDALGNAIDGRGPIFSEKSKGEFFPVERVAPGVTEREPVDTPIHTGIKPIDAMIPVGRGQRELIIGDRQTGKTSIAIDTIINQKNDTRYDTPICIYVAIGQKESKVAKIIATLQEKGAMDYTIVVSASASASASFRYIAPYAATAIAEYFMHQGKDALIVYDDLSKHAVAYREISLLLRRPPGREAYPGDVFYLHSRLLERSARLKKELGGGSITALPIIETQLGDISTYIPTNVISITDGQIYLESELFNKGTRPAINPGLSVSRVGGAAQTKAMKKVAGKLRLELAQYRELAAFSQFASELDEATKKILDKGRILTETLKQPELDPLPFFHEVVIIFAATNGYFDAVPVEKIQARSKQLLDFLNKMHKNILDTIEQGGELNDDTSAALKAALEEFNRIQK